MPVPLRERLTDPLPRAAAVAEGLELVTSGNNAFGYAGVSSREGKYTASIGAGAAGK